MPVRVGIDIEFIPMPAVIAEAYFATAERARQLATPMQEATEIVSSEIDLNFSLEGRPTHWAPLAAGTLKNRVMSDIRGTGTDMGVFREGTQEFQARIFQGFASGMKILQRTGTLYEGAISPSSWTISSSGQTTVAELNDPTEYGHFHLSGTNKMPVRDFTYISEQAFEEIDELFLDFVTAEF